MNVKELIEELQKLDPELPVYVRDFEGDFEESEDVYFQAERKKSVWPYKNTPNKVVIN